MRATALVLIAIATAAPSTCPTFSCAALSGNTCIDVTANSTSTNVEVQQCGDYEYCPLVQTGTSSCVADSPPLLYPGDFCSSSQECYSGTCLQTGVCDGLGLGANCTSAFACNPGLACSVDTLQCQAQLTNGAECYSTYECQNNLICNLGYCTEYLSVPSGLPTDQIENDMVGLALACESGFAALNSEGAWICNDPPASGAELPVKCEAGKPGQCPDKSGKFSTACLCGYNPYGDSYCALFPGDFAGVNLIGNFSALISSNQLCNSFSRFSFNCFARADMRGFLDEYYGYAENYALLTSDAYPLTVDNPECVQSVFTSNYWEPKSALEDYQDALCPRYLCVNSTQNWSPGQCVAYQQQPYQYYVSNLLLLSPCADNTTQCSVGQLQNATCVSTPPLGFPGDYCSGNSDCVSAQCTNNVCTGGLAAGADCVNAYDCSPGLFCNMSALPQVCAEQVGEGADCASDFDCYNNLGCNLGTCVPYYSLAIGVQTDSMQSSGLAELCQSGFATIVTDDPLSGVCAIAPVSAKPTPTPCLPGSSCVAYDGVNSRECVCGYNPQGAAYCPLFEGDAPMQQAILNVNPTQFQYLMGYNYGCNTYSRKSERCFLLTPDSLEHYYYYALNLTYFELFPLITGGETCALEIYAPNYLLLKAHQSNQPITPTPPSNSTATLLLPPVLFSLLSTLT